MTKTIYKSAITGKFVSRTFAESHPDITISQKVEVKPKQKEGVEK